MKITALFFLSFFAFSLSISAQNPPSCMVTPDNGSSYEICHGNVTFTATPCNTCTFDWSFSVGDSVVSGLGTHQVEVYIPRGRTYFDFDIIVTDTVTNQYCAYLYNFDVDPFAGQTNLWNNAPSQGSTMYSGPPNQVWYSYSDSIYFGNPVQHYDDLYIQVYRDGNRVMNNWIPSTLNPTTFRELYSAQLSSTHPVFSVSGEYEVCAFWVDDNNLMCPTFDCVTHYVDAGEGVDIFINNQNPDRDTFCLGEVRNFVARGWVYDSVFWSHSNGNNMLTQSAPNPAVISMQWNQPGLDTLIVQSTSVGAPGTPYTDTLIVYITPQTLSNPLNLGTDTTICSANDSIHLDAGNFSSYRWNTGEQSAAIVTTAPGIYWVEVMDANQCQGVDSIEVILGPPAPINITNTYFCDGDSVQVSSGYTSGVMWSTGETTPTLTIDSAGTYSVVVTPNMGCPGTDIFTVQSLANPFPNLGPDTLVCLPMDSLNLTTNAYSQYLWSNGSQDASITVQTSGTYSVHVTDQNGCQGIDSVEVLFGAPIVVSVPDTHFCAGDSVVVDAGYSSGVRWHNGQTTPTLSFNLVGTYWVEVTPAVGCPGSDTFMVQSFANPTPHLGQDTLLCLPVDSLLLSLPGYTQYAWSNGGQNASTTVQTSGVYSVLVTDQNGCQGTDSIAVTIDPPLSVSIPDTQFCAGDSVQLNAGYTNGVLWSNGQTISSISLDSAGTYWVAVTPAVGCPGADTFSVQSLANPLPNLGLDTVLCPMDSITLAVPGYSQYAWSNGGQNASITVLSDGVYSVLVTDQNGCQGIDSITVNLGSPIPVTVPDTHFCAGDSVQLNAGYSSGVQWSNGQITPTVFVNSAGTYWVEVTPAIGCPGVDTFVVQTLVNPTPNLGPDTLVCFPTDSLILTLPGFTQYAWSTGAQDSSLTVQNDGVYSVLVTDQNGCQGSDSIAVTFSIFPGDPFSQDTLWSCPGDSISLSVNSPWQVTNWSTGATTNTISITQAGGYSVSVLSPDNCPFQDSIRIENFPPLSPNFSYGTSFLTVQFQNQTTGQVSNLWDFGDGNFSTATSPTHSYLNPGSYLVTLQVTGPNQCLYETSDSISVFGTSREETLAEQIKVFPNPASSSLNISFEEGRGGVISARLVNLWGQEVRQKTWHPLRPDDFFQLDLTGLSAGQYILMLTDGAQVYRFPVQVRRK